MSAKMKKNPTFWFKCEKCDTNLQQKDTEIHQSDCPPNFTNTKYDFVYDEILYGTADVKINEEIKSVTPFQKDHMVFLSQSVIQLCSLCIGDKAVVKFSDDSPPVTRTVWPTTEKLLTSVLFTKNGINFLNLTPNSKVTVKKAPQNVKKALKIVVSLLNAPKNLEFNTELSGRLKNLHKDSLVTVGNHLNVMYYGKILSFLIKSIEADLNDTLESFGLDDVFYKVGGNTHFILLKNDCELGQVKRRPQIAGLHNEIVEIRHLMEVSLGITHSNFRLPKAVLLFGSAGTGKTLYAKILADTCGVNVLFVSPSDVYGKSGGIEDDLVKKIKETVECGQSLIIFDELDVLCPVKSTEKRLASTILNVLDEIAQNDTLKIFVLATTNKLEAVDGIFRKPNRFGREIEFPVPNPIARKEILQKILLEFPNSLKDTDVEDVAFNTHGFVGADLFALVSQAALISSKNKNDLITLDDIKASMVYVKPSAMREVQIEVANVKWTDIGGQDKLKLILRQAVEWPLKHSDSFRRLGITPPRGVLMYGPPGCSKTMIAKALATETHLNFLSIKGPELFSKWVGESERAVREVFRKARQVAPSIIFFDEIDALGCERTSNSSASVQERVLAQLLTELDGVSPLGDVTVLAATNRPDRIDKALTRPGRLDRIVYVPLPDKETRAEIFRIKLSKMATSDIDVANLVALTEGYSGAEVNAVCHEAAMMALEENIQADSVEMRHFIKAVELVPPRTSSSLLKIYGEYAANVN